MIIKRQKCTALLLLITSFFCKGIIAQETGNFEELSLEITTTVQKVLPMEPMPITITLSNDTKTPITAYNDINPGVGCLKIYVAKADKPFEQFYSSDWPSITGIRGENVLKPGFRTSVSGYLFYAHPANLDKGQQGQYLFESPGVYRIKTTFKDMEDESKIESNVLTIEAKQPTGDDAAAYEFLKNLKEKQDKDVYYGNFLLTSFGRSITAKAQKVLDKKEEFISRFPNSRYAQYVYYSLGDNYRLGVGKGVKRGIELLEKAASYEDFFLAEDSLLKLIETLSEQGETSKAWKYKKILARRFPDSDEGSDYVEQVYMATSQRRRFVWPLLLVSVAVIVVFLCLALWLAKKTTSRGK